MASAGTPGVLATTLVIATHHVTSRETRTPASAASALPAGPATPSHLLHIRDPTTQARFLIDTGATVSVLPANRKDRRCTPQYNLRAANESDIATYGTRSLTISLDLRRTFTWVFIVADVEQAIIGADLLHAHGLVINLHGRSIQNSTTQYSTVAFIVNVTSPVRPVVNILSTRQPALSLLSQFPSITRPYSAVHPVKHSVLHHLTTNGTPLHVRTRRLPPDKLNAARAEFQHMLELGIFLPSASA